MFNFALLLGLSRSFIYQFNFFLYLRILKSFRIQIINNIDITT